MWQTIGENIFEISLHGDRDVVYLFIISLSLSLFELIDIEKKCNKGVTTSLTNLIRVARITHTMHKLCHGNCMNH